MSFINLLMLGGAAAFSIPLVIHLLSRSRFRNVQWGAMHLLRNVVVVNRRRILLERILLLLIRCAIPVVLALCMARPVLTGFRALAGDSPASLIVLLDDSYSMEAPGSGGGRSSFAVAVDEASRIIGDLKRGSDVSVLLMGGSIEPIFDKPSFDTAGMVKQVRALKPGAAAADPVQGFDAAASAMRSMSQGRREVIVVSDFQRLGWSGVDGPQRQRLAELLGAADVPVNVTFFKVGSDAGRDNIAVESLEFSKHTLGVGQTLQVRATLRNHGRSPRDSVRVYFRQDAAEKAASQISLGPSEQGQLLFTAKFETAGSHLIEVEADSVDLKSDNAITAAVQVIDRVPVLIVSGAPDRQPLRGETDFLEVALQPFASAKGPQLADLIQSTTVDVAGFREELLAGAKAVVLANVPKLDAKQVEMLSRFVEQGGGLLVFSGDKVDLAAYNQLAPRLLPAAIESLAGSAEDNTKHSAIILQRFEHPALTLFNDRAAANLADAVIRQWHKLTPAPGSESSVMMRLESGDPLLMERKVGEGLVIQCATAADADWSNLPMRPFYLPLVQQLVTYGATRVEPSRNVEAGKPLVALLQKSAAGGPLTLVDPSRVKHTLKAVEKSGRAVVEFARTRQPGVYTLGDERGQPIHFAVTAPRTESNLETLRAEEIAQLAQAVGASVVHDGAEYAALDRTRRHGTEVWKPLLVLVAVLLFGEMLLQQYFTTSGAGRQH